MYLHLCRGLPPPGKRSRPSAAVEAVLALYPGLHARLNAVPRYEHDSNTVDDVGTKLETNFANSLSEFQADINCSRAGSSMYLPPPCFSSCNKDSTGALEMGLARVDQAVALAGARVIAGSHEHQRRFGLPVGCRGKTNMATLDHEERYPYGAVKSMWQRSLIAGQYYRQSGITEHAKESKVWMAGIKPQQDELSQVTSYTASLQRYREYAATTLWTWPAMWAELSMRRWFRLYGGKQRTVATFWAETVKGARVRCNSAATGRPLALAYGAAGFSGNGSIGSKGVPVNQMRLALRTPYIDEQSATADPQYQRLLAAALAGKSRQFQIQGNLMYHIGRGTRRLYILVGPMRTALLREAHDIPISEHLEPLAASPGVMTQHDYIPHLQQPGELLSSPKGDSEGRWLYPVRSMAERSRIRGLKCSTSNVIKRRFYDRDVSAALNIRRIAAGPPTRAQQLAGPPRHA
ncbi:hypothetical protein QJQ45_017099 [Haematococcus lacustris]|nr:hypothetical protein QJQ45_017099 [Haematococcus lacustris]